MSTHVGKRKPPKNRRVRHSFREMSSRDIPAAHTCREPNTAHPAVLIGLDGDARPIEGRKIVVDLGNGTSLEVSLLVESCTGTSSVRIGSRGILVVRGGGGNIVDISVLSHGIARRSPLD
jgi:hypothetical protein